MSPLRPHIILYGGTGQAKVVRPIVEYYGSKVIAVVDDTRGLTPPFSDIPLLFGWTGLKAWLEGKDRSALGFSITIGNPHGRARIRYHDQLVAEGLAPSTIVHKTAWVAEDAEIGIGCQIMAGAIVGVGARIGRECIINTKASVDHECILADGCEIAPGATLCGLVQVGLAGTVYAGATVRPRIKIGRDAVVGAGAVVVRDVPDGQLVVGVPARKANGK